MTTRRHGFTLIEILVTIAIIVVIAGLVVGAIHQANEAAGRTRSAGSLRQLALGYTSYSADHNQNLLPGHLSVNRITQFGINPRLKGGDRLIEPGGANAADASSYVWRLAPYVEWDWTTMFTDYAAPSLESAVREEILVGVYGSGSVNVDYPVGLSRVPAYGLNTMYLGGDDVHAGGFADQNPWDAGVEPLAVTRMSAVNYPSRVITFAPCESGNENALGIPEIGNVHYGAPSLRAPFLEYDATNNIWTGRQWTPVSVDGTSTEHFFAEAGATYDLGTSGWPESRSGTIIPVAHLDGSVTSHELIDLAYDMRMWSPRATSTLAVDAPEIQ